MGAATVANRKITLVVGVSGGPDSTCLLHALATVARDQVLAACCVDHGLRPEASDEYGQVESLCREIGVPCHVRRVDTRAYMRERRLSLEVAARELRRQALISEAEEHGASHIALGHTSDDQVETVVMHLFRGAGLKGLSGMTGMNGNLFRPLLDVTHAETVQYCRTLGLRFAQDPTNDDLSNPRNLLRHEIVPAAEVGYPGLRRAILRFAISGRRDIEHLEMEAKEALAFVSRGGELVPELVRALPESLQYHVLRLQALDRGEHVSADTLDDAVARLEPDSSLPNEEWGYPTFQREQVESVSLRAPGRTEVAGARFDVVHGPSGADLRNRMAVSPGQQAYLDLHGSEGLLSVRSRRPGDRMRPLGSPGTRKVQDILVDRRVPVLLRSRVPVVEMNGEIIWLVGLAIADSVRVVEETSVSLHLMASRL